MAVHSARLGAAFDNVAGTRSSVLYTCPSGVRTIVKEIIFSAISGATQGTAVWLNVGASGYRIAVDVTAPFNVIRLERWTVMNSGDTLTWVRTVAASGLIEVVVSGTELEL